MKMILVDDEMFALEQFEQECATIEGIQLVGKFSNAKDALQYATEHMVDFAILDICMPGMDGIELGKKLKELNPDLILIYVTGYTKYVVDALKLKADYCIMKPYDQEDVRDAIQRAKLLSNRFKKRIKVVTFGRFEIYVDDRTVCFSNQKARELFAYCIHKEGGIVKMNEAIDILWPDRPYDEKVKRLYRKAVASVVSTLSEVGIQQVFISNRGNCYINRAMIECDLYAFEVGDIEAIQKSLLLELGYFTEFSWAEYRIEMLRKYLHESKEANVLGTH